MPGSPATASGDSVAKVKSRGLFSSRLLTSQNAYLLAGHFSMKLLLDLFLSLLEDLIGDHNCEEMLFSTDPIESESIPSCHLGLS